MLLQFVEVGIGLRGLDWGALLVPLLSENGTLTIEGFSLSEGLLDVVTHNI